MKVVIVGAGEVGFYIASRLALENKDVVVIDMDASALRRVSDSLDVQVVAGSGSSPLVLEEAGIRDAEIILAVTNSDEVNLVACLVANMVSPSIKKLARIRNADYDGYHDEFRGHAPHIDKVINPEIEVVRTIENLMNVPGAVDVGEFAEGLVKFIGVRLEADSRLSGVQLSDLPALLGEERPLIAAVVRDDVLIVPRGNDRIHAGDLVYFISYANRLKESLAIFDKSTKPVKRALIVGGGRVGKRLAKLLEKRAIQTKLIEKNEERCRELADEMNKVVVLHGDGSDQSLLLEENISDMDVVITLTHDEETNILVSLLAKRMGVAGNITKISKFNYFPLMATIGIEQVVSTRLSAIDSILQHIRRGKVLSALSVHGDQAEVLEAVALETSDIVGKPLKNVSFPKGSLLIGVVRGEDIIIPSGDTVVEHEDRIIIFAVREAIAKVEKMLMVKLGYV